ncbi:DNA polymerase iota [Chionoecetes opilio]|uniref:rRNA biogenesis protein RRP36 n=1 Tax=Chionoecetes opilio TaxID=41210 RepID=A0A8J4XS93_CHIOP|nr:DNA polymerase iota [Chionoecetes opilio]
MEELLKLQEDMGTKAFRKKVLKTGGGIARSSNSPAGQGGSSAQLKRANKNRPAEVPMMRQAAPRLANLEPGQRMKRQIIRDPRFDDLSGNLNLKSWQGNYSFLREMRKKEKEVLKKELKTEEDPEKKHRMKSIIQRIENQERERGRKEKEQEVKRLERQEQREALRQGRKPKLITNKEPRSGLAQSRADTVFARRAEPGWNGLDWASPASRTRLDQCGENWHMRTTVSGEDDQELLIDGPHFTLPEDTWALCPADHRRTIIHLDVDCFYAQVEMVRDPSLRDKPLGVKQKNLMVTSNYVARSLGVKKSMWIKEALEILPNLILVDGSDLTYYRQFSSEISAVAQTLTPAVERLGMDENFVDVTEIVGDYLKQSTSGKIEGHIYGDKEPSEALPGDPCGCGCRDRLTAGTLVAKKLRQQIFETTGITCCAGIAHNKLLAKLVCGYTSQTSKLFCSHG